jgi:hypothetical protein
VKPFGYELMLRSALYDWQVSPESEEMPANAPLPDGAAKYLSEENPRLVELRARYEKADKAVTTPLVWTSGHSRSDYLRYFRGDGRYLWQVGGPNMNLLGYALTAYYATTVDRLGMMAKLTDDAWFGNHTLDVNSRRVSRDLLDSIIEISFLERHLGLGSLKAPTVLDIGAGYGRVAHRMVEALPGLERYLCTDAVAASTFLSEYYLRFRGCEGRAVVVPLDEIDARLQREAITLAINVHSFSECQPSAVDWWLTRLERSGVQYLFVVPNAISGNDGQALLTNDGRDFSRVIEMHGYRLVVKEPKYLDPVVQRFGINPTYHHLFQRS